MCKRTLPLGRWPIVCKHNDHQEHEVPEELLSGLRANYKKPEDLIGESGLLKQLTKLLVEKALDSELTEHLGHDRHESVANASGNARNGKSKRTLKGEFGGCALEDLGIVAEMTGQKKNRSYSYQAYVELLSR